MTITDETELTETFPMAYTVAAAVYGLRRRGYGVAALEAQVRLARAGRCIHCGHVLRRSDSLRAGCSSLILDAAC